MKLKLDEVAVESFATTAEDAETRGTVQGQEFTYPHYSCPAKYTCPECASPVMAPRDDEA